MTNLTKDEKIKVVEIAIDYLKNVKTNYICHALYYGIEFTKNIEIEFDGGYGIKLLNRNLSDLLIVAKDYVSEYITDIGNEIGIYCANEFYFDGSAWFDSTMERMRLLRIKILQLYLEKLQNK